MTYPIYRILLVALLSLSIGGVVFWVSLRPSRGTSRLGMRGLKRQQSLLRQPLWASVEPFVRWMAARVGPILSPSQRAKLDEQLTHAGDLLGLSADEYFACMVTTALLGGVAAGVGVNLYGMNATGLAVLCGLLLGAFVPYMIVDGERASRFQAINRGLPYAIDMMALAMSAGLDFPNSVHQVVEKAKANEALREELGFFLQQLQVGNTRAHALREFGARVPIECVLEFAQALIQAEERGNPVAAVLEIQAGTARIRRSNVAEKAAENLRAKLLLPIFLLMGVGLELVITPTSMMMDTLMDTLKK